MNKETQVLKFPTRHNYDCHSSCDLCLEDHTRLADFLYEVGMIPRRLVDALGDYRRWLDRNKIDAEGVDGWGNRNTFNPENIRKYLQENWGLDESSTYINERGEPVAITQTCRTISPPRD